MSVKVSSWVWHEAPQDIAGNELILMLALADVADDQGRCRFVDDEAALTYEGLAEKVRVDRRTIERLIPKLRARGVLGHFKGVKGRPNEFAVLVPWAKKSADILSGSRYSEGVDSPTAVQDSPTASTEFTDNSDSRSSLKRIDVTTRSSTSDADASDYSEDVVRLCRLLALLVSQNGHKVGEIGKVWWSACERLMRLDGYTVEQIEIIIRWSTSNEFWSANIRSMPKLREKFSTLRAQRNTELSKKQKTSTVAHGAEVDELLRVRESKRLAVTA